MYEELNSMFNPTDDSVCYYDSSLIASIASIEIDSDDLVAEALENGTECDYATPSLRDAGWYVGMQQGCLCVDFGEVASESVDQTMFEVLWEGSCRSILNVTIASDGCTWEEKMIRAAQALKEALEQLRSE